MTVMKLIKPLAGMTIIMSAWNCTPDEIRDFPDSQPPVISLQADETYSVPGRNFTIEAILYDDLGLASVNLISPELYLDKTIFFDMENEKLVTEYELSYEFLAPESASGEDRFIIGIRLEDVSGNIVEKKLVLRLDGEFNAPVVSNMRPQDGAVLLMSAEPEIRLTISFDITDETGIGQLAVSQETLNINEKLDLEGIKSWHFEKEITVPAEKADYVLNITATDTFIEPNTLEMTTGFSVSEQLETMFLADVPTDTDLNADDIVGVPMICHEVNDGVFTFRYYADEPNKEIRFLGQESSFEPHCFGAFSDGILENSTDATPVLLEEEGYYEITVDPANLTYEVCQYTPSSEIFVSDESRPLIVVGHGMTAETADITWTVDTSNQNAWLHNDPENPYILTKDVELTGSDIQIVISGAGWSPFWRLDANGVAVFNAGTEHTYTGAVGYYTLKLDTELSRLSVIRKK